MIRLDIPKPLPPHGEMVKLDKHLENVSTHVIVLTSCAFVACSMKFLASFPGSSAPEREIEFMHVEKAWYFFSRENPQR